ncbi:MAG: EAL domain-containing protein [Thermodesulfobacteriota bacterium]
MSPSCYRILLVDDEEGDCRPIAGLLAQLPGLACDLTWLADFDQAREAIARQEHDLYLLGYRSGKGQGLDLLDLVHKQGSPAPVILLADTDDQVTARRAIEAGAADCLVKDQLDLPLLGRAIRYAMERKQAEAQILSMAYYDGLTGLPNRTLFRDRLQAALAQARRYRRTAAVLLLDIDNFKRINDTLGHGVGDQLVQETGGRLRECLRGSDTLARLGQEGEETTVARLGGDEFIILLTELRDVHDAARVAQRMRDAIALPFRINGHELFVSASIGIACYPQDEGCDTVDGILKNADTAMYHAKELGKNNYQFYKESMNSSAMQRLVLESQLRWALEREELELFYQPQVALASGRLVGVEALLRWRHPGLGLVPPARFIPLAEETGLIVPMGDWVLHAACRQGQRWHEEGWAPVRVSVNLSSQQFRQPGLEETVTAALAASGLAPASLELEITESIMMQNLAASRQVLERLKAMGVRISLDDFGTGYSSLSYLKSFPLTALKIDRSFLRDLAKRPEDTAIINVIIAMARHLGMEVCAEGVETVEQLGFLVEQGCDVIQGYLISTPLPAGEVVRFFSPAQPPGAASPAVLARAGGALPALPAAGPAAAAGSDLRERPLSILLAGASDEEQRAARETLRQARLANELVTVSDAAELARLLQPAADQGPPEPALRPGLILLDRGLTGLDEPQALAVIRAGAERQRIPILLLADAGGDQPGQAIEELGCTAGLARPISLPGLLAALEAWPGLSIELVRPPAGE